MKRWCSLGITVTGLILILFVFMNLEVSADATFGGSILGLVLVIIGICNLGSCE